MNQILQKMRAIKNRIINSGKKSFFRTLRTYHRISGKFSKSKTGINELELKDFWIKIRDNTLELPSPRLRKLNPTYTLIRPLEFHLKININKMKHFKSLLKWHDLKLERSVVFRNYSLGFFATLRKFDKPSLALNLPPTILSIDRKNINILKGLRINEEIIKILPYVKKKDRKKLLQVPVVKSPLHKYIFLREEIKLLREIIARQNKTSWVNIKIFEIYDKFHVNSYSNIKQTPGSKDLECALSPRAQHKKSEKNYYLVVGQRIDTGVPIKAIVDSADIKKGNFS